MANRVGPAPRDQVPAHLSGVSPPAMLQCSEPSFASKVSRKRRGSSHVLLPAFFRVL